MDNLNNSNIYNSILDSIVDDMYLVINIIKERIFGKENNYGYYILNEYECKDSVWKLLHEYWFGKMLEDRFGWKIKIGNYDLIRNWIKDFDDDCLKDRNEVYCEYVVVVFDSDICR